MVDIDRNYMRLALREAKKGIGRTSPNPCVGAVVVKNNKVIGKGYHKRAGTAHAEVHALREAGQRAKGATLYVTLEPCNHTGRTPPCTEAVFRAGISRVVIGMLDPNTGVAGGGAETLASKKIAVTSGILEEECREINLPFIKHSTKGLPGVILKAGMSIDGRIAAAPGQSTRITGQKSLQRVHAIRNQVDAILVGAGTVQVDDPSLTTRFHGRGSGRDPLRLVLDAQLNLPVSAKMIQNESSAQTWIFCGRSADRKKRSELEKAGAVIKTVPVSKGVLNLKVVLAELGKAQITSVLVEGGSKVHGSFLQANLADQILLFVAPIFLGDLGVPLASFSGKKKVKLLSKLKIMSTRRYGDDVFIDGRFF